MQIRGCSGEFKKKSKGRFWQLMEWVHKRIPSPWYGESFFVWCQQCCRTSLGWAGPILVFVIHIWISVLIIPSQIQYCAMLQPPWVEPDQFWCAWPGCRRWIRLRCVLQNLLQNVFCLSGWIISQAHFNLHTGEKHICWIRLKCVLQNVHLNLEICCHILKRNIWLDSGQCSTV